MIECQNIIKEFGLPPQRILHGLTFNISDGEFVSISGRSGSGKSTLLYIISSLDMPTFGSVEIDQRNISQMSSEDVHRFRNTEVGFIFQFHYLLSELTALENVLLPTRNLGLIDKKNDFAIDLLFRLGLKGHEHKFPSQLSGGEQQRVAIARALILDPKYLFADEPTGNLDTQNALIVMNMLKEVNKEKGTTICLVTHEPSFAKMAEREIFLVDGSISNI
jgi:lipoprotein-releasing system ATP-binding protein